MPEWETIKVFMIMGLTAVAKLLLTVEEPPKNETNRGKWTRRYRASGGVMAGFILAYYGHDWLIARLDALTVSDTTMVIIVLTLTGEHVFRGVMTVSLATVRQILMMGR